MAGPFFDRVLELVTTVGTGPVTATGTPPAQWAAWNTVGNGSSGYYLLLSGDGSQWEVGHTTVTVTGAASTITRSDVRASSNGGAAIWLSGTSTICSDVPAAFLNSIPTGGAGPVDPAYFVASTGTLTLANPITAPIIQISTNAAVLGAVVAQTGLTVQSGGMVLQAGGMTVQAGGVTIVTGGLDVAGGGLAATSGGVVLSGGTADVLSCGLPATFSGGAKVSGTLDLSAAATVLGTVAAHTGLTVQSGGIVLQAGGMTVQAGGVTIVTGGLDVGGGGFVVSSGGVYLSGGTADVLSCSLPATFSGGAKVSGTLDLSAAATVLNTGTANVLTEIVGTNAGNAMGALHLGANLSITSGTLNAAGGGGLTSVVAGNNLAGGTITSTGTISMASSISGLSNVTSNYVTAGNAFVVTPVSVIATGTTQATALLLGHGETTITGGAANTGVMIYASVGQKWFIRNRSGSAKLIYPWHSTQLEALGTDIAAPPLADGASMTVTMVSPTQGYID